MELRASAVSGGCGRYLRGHDEIRAARSTDCGGVLFRGDAASSASEQGNRQAIREANFRYIILPSQERRVPARALLDRLGATIRTEGRLLVGEFSDAANAAEAGGEAE